MATLEWDQPAEKFYQGGVDRGVLYLADGTAAAWSGLIGVDHDVDSELKSYYLDGIKYLESATPGNFVGKLRAFTYPDEFDEVVGVARYSVPGLFFHEQPHKKFGLTYRTQIGNELDSDYGYIIHLLYNLTAIPDPHSFQTQGPSDTVGDFSWSLTGVPPRTTGYRPAVHVSIKSTETNPEVLEAVENILYGTSTTTPRLLSVDELKTMFGQIGALIITSLGAGVWLAADTDDSYISMVSLTDFVLTDANIEWLNPYTYRVSDTYIHNTAEPALETFTLKAPGGNVWEWSITVDGTIDISLSVADAYTLDYVHMKSPSGDGWNITVTDDGTLNIDLLPPQEYYLDQFRMKSSDDNVWVITATDDGYIDITEE